MFIITYQVSTGQIAWIYAAETCTDISLGAVIYMLWFTVLILMLTSEPLMDSAIQAEGVFFMFGIFSFFAAIFTQCFIKETKHI